MESAPHPIIDRPLAARRLLRAARAPAPFLLERASDDLADRLAAVNRRFHRVLDLGTPGGAFAAVARRASPAAWTVETAALPPPASSRRDGLVVAAEERALPFAPGAFDLALSGFALHLVDDLPGALVQVRRALRPDGLLLACLPGGRTLHELRAALAEAEGEETGGASPRVLPFADVRDMGALLQRAGFALPVADVDSVTVRYAHAFALFADLRAMGATNPLRDRLRRATRRAVFARAAALYHERFGEADGRIPATFELIWLSGWAPDESQPKPLRPGSARARLADALGASEERITP